ncbi:hypothetical protein COB64_04010 [Candidatus Wolfebacteria bacterium]|nr:MAG: hypothetical protein COB64_04010 [Candidatus Wolfebacteria bacterium]
MNTITKNRVYSYQDLKLDKHILKASTKAEYEAKLDGMFAAQRLVPAPIGDKFFSLIGSTIGAFNEMLAYANKAIQGTINGYQGVNDQQVVEDQKKKIDARINIINEEAGFKRTDLTRLVLTYPWQWRKYVLAAIIGISGVEAVLAAKSFQLFVSNLMMSLLVALLVWAALVTVAHILPKTIRMGRTITQRLLIGLACLVILSLVFYILGEFRVEYLSQVDEFAEASGAGSINGILGISPISFMVLNLFFLSVSTLLSFFYLPNREQRQEKEAWDQLTEDVDTMERKIEKLRLEKQSIEDEFNFSQEKRASIVAYAKYTEAWIKTLYEKSIHTFQKENMLKRKDKQIPDCFEQDPPDLNYFYNNINL